MREYIYLKKSDIRKARGINQMIKRNNFRLRRDAQPRTHTSFSMIRHQEIGALV